MTNDLIARLRALSRHEHSDYSIGDEAADALEEAQAEREVIVAEAVKYADKSGRLEAKVERLEMLIQQPEHSLASIANAEHARAERLAEALRSFAEDARNAFYATGCASCDGLASRLANSAAALRDHDQEGK